MLAIVAAVLFLIALVMELLGIGLGVVTALAVLTAGLMCVALHLAGIGANRRLFTRL
jgi:hypothetical protein